MNDDARTRLPIGTGLSRCHPICVKLISPTVAASLLVSVAIAACSKPVTLAGEQSASAIVYGTATVAAGGPAVGATIVVDLYLVSCSISDPLTSATTVTGSDGHYRMLVGGVNVAGEQCVRVTGTANGASVTRDAPVNLRPEGTDSVRVDLGPLQ